MRRLPTSHPLPTVVLRHRISGVKRIMNAAEYALKIGGISKHWRLEQYRGVETPDSIIQRELRQAEIEWEKTRSGRDDRPQRRFEERAIKQNIVIEETPEPTPPAPPPSDEPVAAPSSPLETSQEPAPAPGSAAAKEPLLGPQDGLITPPKRGRGRPRKPTI